LINVVNPRDQFEHQTETLNEILVWIAIDFEQNSKCGRTFTLLLAFENIMKFAKTFK